MVSCQNIKNCLVVVVLAASTFTVNAITTITSVDQLIEEIKQLRNSFENFEAIQNYIDEHCGHLKNSLGIKSAIKNQFEYLKKWQILRGGFLWAVPLILNCA